MQYHLNIIIKLSSSNIMQLPSQSVVNSIIHVISNNLDQQINLNQQIQAIPQKMQQNLHEINHQILSSYQLVPPLLKKQYPAYEGIMPKRYLKEKFIQSKIPVFKDKEQYLSKTSNNFYDKYRGRSSASRYTSTPELDTMKKNLKVQFVNESSGKLLKIDDRSQVTTAKSFRSVIELQEQINTLRTTYLKMQRQKQKKLNEIKPEQQSKKKLSKDYTFDYNCYIIDKDVHSKGFNISSPLRSKSISMNKVVKRVRNHVIHQEEKNVQEELSRITTGYKQKQLRIFSNLNRRQVSHIPYIQLSQNSKLFQNLNIFHGPNSPNSQLSGKKQFFQTGFRSYFENNPQKQTNSQLITEDADQVSFPINKFSQMKNLNDGYISKQSKHFNKSSILNKSGRSSQEICLDYKAIQSGKNNIMDRYYNIKAMNY